MPSAGGGSPFQDSAGTLLDAPARVMFEGVMPSAEVREVVRRSASSERSVDGVVDVAAGERHSTAGEPAMLVARTEQAPDLFARSVAVHAENRSGFGVFQDPLPVRGFTGETASCRRVDRAVSFQDRRWRTDGEERSVSDATDGAGVLCSGPGGQMVLAEQDLHLCANPAV